jgi:hypothetical protein
VQTHPAFSCAFFCAANLSSSSFFFFLAASWLSNTSKSACKLFFVLISSALVLFINAICLYFCINAKSFTPRFVKKSAYNYINLHYITIIKLFNMFNLDYVLKDYYFWKNRNKNAIVNFWVNKQFNYLQILIFFILH